MRVIVVLVTVALLLGIFFGLRQSYKSEKKISLSPTPSKISTTLSQATNVDESESVFVPYWTLSDLAITENNISTYVYFGITVDKSGIDESDQGYKLLNKFNEDIPSHARTLLTLRMLDTQTNSSILRDQALQDKIINDTITLAQKYEYDGIVLDLETSSLPLDAVVKRISSFVTRFYSNTKKTNLNFQVALYGDTFVRIRPYDVELIGKNSDGIFIMTYDYHKAGGNPGPNFPLKGHEEYGYDLVTMIDDFTKVVPPEKLHIIFGMYGYDWMVNAQGKSTQIAESLSLNKIKQDFLKSCTFKDCKIEQNKNTLEKKITYKDEEGKSHVIWFEDEASVKKKKEQLRSRGISQFSYWAYSYY